MLPCFFFLFDRKLKMRDNRNSSAAAGSAGSSCNARHGRAAAAAAAARKTAVSPGPSGNAKIEACTPSAALPAHICRAAVCAVPARRPR
jgi:hypothetical protein